MTTGKVFLVGAGPGDPGLLTLRAAELLRTADSVIYDRLVHPEVLRHARAHARLIYSGKEGGGEQMAQDEINQLLIAQARLGRQVVRLKGGDPFVFGRGGEEALALVNAGVEFEVVPGVSSGIAAPAAAGIPVTHRQLSTSVTLATASLSGGEPDWKHLAGAPTLVLFMAGKKLEASTTSLIQAGRLSSAPAAIIEAGTWAHQRVLVGTLENIASVARDAEIGSPAMLVVGEVVRLRAELAQVTGSAGRAFSLDEVGA